jgi:murein DD-endopeptidase MepM/ murein hydrolase activator NlpD
LGIGGAAMTRKAIGAIIASIVGLVFTCGAGVMLLFGSGGAASACIPGLPSGLPTDMSAGAPTMSAPAGGWRPIGRFDTEQVGFAATITTVGAQLGVPIRGWIIAVATALQESDLRNPAGGPDDSIGLFQQRPSQGWGTPEQLHDPAYAAGKFYAKLLTVAGWQQMALTDAAQAVQRSAFPDAYAKHEPDATLLVSTIAGLVDPSGAPLMLDCGGAAGPWTQPVIAPIVSGFRTPDRPTHDGVDLGAARGTPIKAAAAGVVTVVRCNIVPASHGCDVDGSPQTPGCGWYVDIEHAGGVVTRYCHMLTRPAVNQGQSVVAGQIIGIVGTSGHSSGPHLHFEVHLGDHSSASATNPIPFMAAHCAPLGEHPSATRCNTPATTP